MPGGRRRRPEIILTAARDGAPSPTAGAATAAAGARARPAPTSAARNRGTPRRHSPRHSSARPRRHRIEDRACRPPGSERACGAASPWRPRAPARDARHCFGSQSKRSTRARPFLVVRVGASRTRPRSPREPPCAGERSAGRAPTPRGSRVLRQLATRGLVQRAADPVGRRRAVVAPIGVTPRRANAPGAVRRTSRPGGAPYRARSCRRAARRSGSRSRARAPSPSRPPSS
jgi:hypothetical protein